MKYSKCIFGVGSVLIVSFLSSLVSMTANATQPSAGVAEFADAESGGVAVEGRTDGGDAVAKFWIRHQAREASDKYLYVKFMQCTSDQPTSSRPLANLDQIIADGRGVAKRQDAETPKSRWRACVDQPRLLVSPGEEQTLAVAVDFLTFPEREDGWGLGIHVDADVYYLDPSDVAGAAYLSDLDDLVKGRQAAAQLPLSLFYKLDQVGNWANGTYIDVFGTPDGTIDGAPGTLNYADVVDTMPVDVPAYRRSIPLPEELRHDPFGRTGEALEAAERKGALLSGDSKNIRWDIQTGEDLVSPTFGPSRIDLPDLNLNLPLTGRPILTRPGLESPVLDLPDSESDSQDGITDRTFRSSGFESRDHGLTHRIQGQFSTVWTDHALHPAFGFRVVAWHRPDGNWREIGWSWVQSDGRWQIDVPAASRFGDQGLRLSYHTDNVYYRPQNQDGNTYLWADVYDQPIPTLFDVGHRFVNTDTGTYNGLGEMVEAAMTNWSTLYWRGSINPVPQSPQEMFYPNTWYDCGDGSGMPGSCASFGVGPLWLIPRHGTDPRVVIHELSHKLQSLYWDSNSPANSGGSHSLSQCYPDRLGMTLGEGFANFMPAWVQYGSGHVASGGFGTGRRALPYDPESNQSPPSCANGWENEVWVARTFWDLFDSYGEDGDILRFADPGAVTLRYLTTGVGSNGDARDMRDYRQIYRSWVRSQHQPYIDAIMDLNRM